MTTRLVKILQQSECVPDDDFLVLCLATNVDSNFLVVESYAGTGKTTLILDIVRRLDCNKCILLSFSKTAVKVARIRLVKETGDWLKCQTFDSLFLHLHGARVQSPEPTFQHYRDMVVHTTTEDLSAFMCRTQYVNYKFADIQYVFVDEAQDSPPEAFAFLNLCRTEGKQVIVTGDRNQAIFRFLNTASLFDSIPSCHSVHHQLVITHRCIQPICDFVNSRFGLHMKSDRPDLYDSKNRKLDVVIQCRLNSTMGQLYTALLSHLSINVRVNLAEGESTDKFYDFAWSEVMSKYGVQLEKAQDILSFMEERAKRCKGLVLVLSTVHRFKGDQTDLTILAPDIDVHSANDDPAEEHVKYVACTRPRYGLLHTFVPRYIGNPLPLAQLASDFCARTWHVGVNSVSQVVNSPIMLVRLMGVPQLREIVELALQAYQQRTITHCLPVDDIDDIDGSLHDMHGGPHDPNAPTAMDIAMDVAVSTTDTTDTCESAQSVVESNDKKHPPPCHSVQCFTIVGTACDIATMWLVEQKAFQSNTLNILVSYPENKMTVKDDRKLLAMLNQKVIDKELVHQYKKLLLHAKMVSLLCRYLVVRKRFSVTHPAVVPGVFHAAILQHFSFSHSVLALRKTVLQCARDDYVNLMTDFVFPPLFADPSNWQAVNLHGNIPSLPFSIKGTFDLMIYDKQSQMHLIEVKCVKHLKFAHFFQTILYNVMSRINAGVNVHNTCVWSLRDSTFHCLPRDLVDQIAQKVFANLELFNQSVVSRTDPRFYPKQYELSVISF